MITKLLLSLVLFTSTFFISDSYTPFLATAYSLKGRTATGIRVREGIVAADRRVLKMGTTIHIKGMGKFLVADTGGAIKGRRIDIYMSDVRRARKFGKRKVMVKVCG